MEQKKNLGALEGICEFHLRYFRGSSLREVEFLRWLQILIYCWNVIKSMGD